MTFTPFHRGGSGPPLVCLHRFLGTWRTLATPEGRRRATRYLTRNFEHIPAELLAHELRAAAAGAALPLIDRALTEDWSLDAERITCPVRIVWGTEDRLLSWPAAAARFRTEWLPQRRSSRSRTGGTRMVEPWRSSRSRRSSSTGTSTRS